MSEEFECEICGKTFNKNQGLSLHKKTIHGIESYWGNKRAKQDDNKNIECEFCQCKFGNNAHLSRHINKEHSDEITVEGYWNKYLNHDNKSGHCKHCGEKLKFKGLSKNYSDFCCLSCGTTWYAENTDRAYKAAETIKMKMEKDPTFCLRPSMTEYWIHKGFSEEEAVNMVSINNTTFSKKICIEKHGEVDGVKIWKERQRKWQENCKRSNFSKISQELFWSIKNNIQIGVNDIFFATYINGEYDLSGKNNEFRVEGDSSFYKLNFYIPSLKYCIEFDGDYWHGEKRGNNERDYLREQDILKCNDIKIVHVKERDYNSDKNGVVMKLVEEIQSLIAAQKIEE